MSVEYEIRFLRKQLSRLQKRIDALESTTKKQKSDLVDVHCREVGTIVNKKIDEPVTIKKKKSNTFDLKSRLNNSFKKNSNQTIRSRSYKVMRHLISIVDLPTIVNETTPSESKNDSISINQIKKINVMKPTSSPNCFKSHQKTKPNVHQVKKETVLKSTTKQEKFKEDIQLAQTIIPKTHANANVKIKKFKLIPKDARLYELIKSEYQGLCLPSDDELGMDYTYEDKRWSVSPEKLQSRSRKLIRKGSAGVWVWNEGLENAEYRSLRKRPGTSPIPNYFAQFTGYATEGPHGHHPPPDSSLPQKLLNEIQKHRWYWFKDRWLLFSTRRR